MVKTFPFTLFDFHPIQLLQIFLIGLVVRKAGEFGVTVMFLKENDFGPTVEYTRINGVLNKHFN